MFYKFLNIFRNSTIIYLRNTAINYISSKPKKKTGVYISYGNGSFVIDFNIF